MQFTNKFYCHFDLLRVRSEDYVQCKKCTLSIIGNFNGKKFEYSIFLGKCENTKGYEVRVYKLNSDDKYVPHQDDNVVDFVETYEDISFFFDDFISAKNFLKSLPYNHIEFKKRPINFI